MSEPRAKPQPMRPELEALTDAAREAAAEELFGIVQVKAALLAAARDGFRALVLRSVKALDLRGTAAAVTLERWVRKEGLTLEWGTPVVVVEHGIDKGETCPLVIRWEGRRLDPS